MTGPHHVEQQAHAHHDVRPVRRRHHVDEPRQVLVGQLGPPVGHEVRRGRGDRQARRVLGVALVAHEVRVLRREQRQQIGGRDAARAAVAEHQRLELHHGPVGAGHHAHGVVDARAHAPRLEVRQPPRHALEVLEARDGQRRPRIADPALHQRGVRVDDHAGRGPAAPAPPSPAAPRPGGSRAAPRARRTRAGRRARARCGRPRCPRAPRRRAAPSDPRRRGWRRPSCPETAPTRSAAADPRATARPASPGRPARGRSRRRTRPGPPTGAARSPPTPRSAPRRPRPCGPWRAGPGASRSRGSCRRPRPTAGARASGAGRG